MEDCAFFHVMTSVATDLDDCVNGGGDGGVAGGGAGDGAGTWQISSVVNR